MIHIIMNLSATTRIIQSVNRGLFNIYNRWKNMENIRLYYPPDSICSYMHTQKWQAKSCKITLIGMMISIVWLFFGFVGKHTQPRLNLWDENLPPPGPSPTPYPPLPKDKLNPPTPSVYVSNDFVTVTQTMII